MLKPLILIIDDDSAYLALLNEALEADFTVKSALNFNEAEALIKEFGKFDIALIDENIGDECGSEWIKTKVESNNAAFSFVLYSNSAAEETILKGLECGADDFLTQPISLLVLANKLHQLIKNKQKIKSFETEINSKNRVINVSMAQASKYGSCMHLTTRLNKCFTIEKIKDEILTFLHDMNLHGCLAFYPINSNPVFFKTESGSCSPVEIGVIKLLKDKPRLYRFGARTIFNHPLASILIFNLEEGTIETDIYIDALASVIECIGARVEFIAYQKSLLNVQSEIKKAVFTTKKMIEISKNHQQEIMNEIVQSMGQSFHVLDMNVKQEEYLTGLIHNALKKHSQDDINFLEIGGLLDNALMSLDRLKSLNSEHEDIKEDEEDLF